jgi:hypothetical protein
MADKLCGEFKILDGKLFYVMEGGGRYVRIRCYRAAWQDWYKETKQHNEFVRGLDHGHVRSHAA